MGQCSTDSQRCARSAAKYAADSIFSDRFAAILGERFVATWSIPYRGGDGSACSAVQVPLRCGGDSSEWQHRAAKTTEQCAAVSSF